MLPLHHSPGFNRNPSSSVNTDKGKGKGKQRAYDADPAQQGSSGEASNQQDVGGQALVFSVRFTDGLTEDLLDICIGQRETIRDLKRRIRLLRPTIATRRLRLIHIGRVLTDGTLLVPWMLSLLARQKRQEEETQSRFIDDALDVVKQVRSAAATSLEGSSARSAAVAPEEIKPLWLHCSVGEEETEIDAAASTTADATITANTAQIQPLQGFDRLRDAGFSDEDIDRIRNDFREETEARGERSLGDDEEHARALEDQWMEGLTGHDEASASSSSVGSYSTLFKGLLIGFSFPFLPLFFFRTQIFSKKMQQAVLLGCAFNFAFGILRMLG
ncbi:uncharacterized protein L969DRAFT_46117 [Mixia osmundae IAM 14324]|uniref:Ubiquitin-like domain-containing protein n=1 Tax=Mixia osmundae (strain CBS 9802 / IAM 14324 / JCM 22182 / KY 12970) TaxID=764103 RepID=G7E5C4_MIXOS|nr:uncharacterized protein L969DRAFT_46117 [Mixia osmundae IAM 14324]KEI40816.1 hypothetical protein L969DRAFT_46117 [Mixia osmundae IAM 14324]GAA98034.1 hypothetical protein E5Q_04714 [Mixia osmundae IAM 14324]